MVFVVMAEPFIKVEGLFTPRRGRILEFDSSSVKTLFRRRAGGARLARLHPDVVDVATNCARLIP
jgi:hypothetical protein